MNYLNALFRTGLIFLWLLVSHKFVFTCTSDAGDIVPPVGQNFPINLCQGGSMGNISVSYEAEDEEEPDSEDYDYIFLLANENGEIISTGQGNQIALLNLSPGSYQIWGLSYRKTNPESLQVYLQNIEGDSQANDIAQIQAENNGSAYCLNIEGKDATGNDAIIRIGEPISTMRAEAIPATCGENNGKLTITEVIGGTPPYMYAWENGEFSSSNVISGLESKVHKILVRDAFGCEADERFYVLKETAPSDIVLQIVNATCQIQQGQIAITDVVGGTEPFQYSLDGVEFQNENSFTGLEPGNYTIYAKDANGCIVTKSTDLTRPEGPSGLESVVKGSVCGEPTGSLEVTKVIGGSSPFIYSLDGIVYKPGPKFEDLGPGSYDVYVKDASGCVYSEKANISLTEGPTALEILTSASACAQATGSIAITNTIGGNGPYSYSIDGNTYQSESTFDGLAAGIYTLYVQDANSCIFQDTASVKLSEGPSGVELVVVASACNQPTGSIDIGSVSGGNGPYSFALDGTAFQTELKFEGLGAGAYNLIVKDAVGCILSQSVNILMTDGPQSVETSINSATCEEANGSITIMNVSGGESPYSYSLDGINFQTDQEFETLSPGVYNLYVKDANGCLIVDTLNVETIGGLSSLETLSTPTGCNSASGSGSISITNLTGGSAPYSFSLDSINFQSNPGFDGLVAGTYALYVKDANGCLLKSEFEIESEEGPDSIEIFTGASACKEATGSIAISNVNGGLGPFEYALDSVNYQAMAVFTSLDTGMYTVYIRDANFCVYTQEAEIGFMMPPTDAVVEADDEMCGQDNGQIRIKEISGGSAPYLFELAGLREPQTDSLFTNLSADNYELIVEDNDGCKWSQTVKVGELNGPDSLSLDISMPDCNAANGSIIVVNIEGGTAPYLYGLDSSAYQSGNSFSGLELGVYEVKVKDEAGCFKSQVVVLSENDGPQSILYDIVNAACGQEDGEIRITNIEGGTAPYSFRLGDNVVQSDSVFSGLRAESYELKVLDHNGCTLIENVEVPSDTCENSFRFVRFDAVERRGRRARLEWEVINQAAGGVLIAEKSVDSLLFSDIEAFDIFLFREKSTLYRSEDLSVSDPVMFYRASYLSPEGQIEHSEIKKVVFKEWGTFLVEFYPNPVAGDLLVEVMTDQPGISDIWIADPMGRIVVDDKKELEFGRNRFSIETRDWAAGIYILQIRKDEEVYQQRIIKR